MPRHGKGANPHADPAPPQQTATHMKGNVRPHGSPDAGQAGAMPQASEPPPLAEPTAPAEGPPGEFGAPTARPDEDPLAGLGEEALLAEDHNMILRVAAELYPHPDLLVLLRAAEEG